MSAWPKRLRGDGGSATAELVVIAPVLAALMLFVVYCGRPSETRLRIEDAAHQSARAASTARDAATATSKARTVADEALTDAGIHCQGRNLAVETAQLHPGGTVRVALSCTVDLSDLTLIGVPGAVTLSARVAAPVDVYRGMTTGRGGR
ncbi:TadE family protein [Streptomyces sp. NPDC059009]|uniref:TadE family protein n=1 Tax=Streptomyces sp. NPDC059009 TaxID=3346694 RepID=UPI0036BDEA21